MDRKAKELLEKLKAEGLTPRQEELIGSELEREGSHEPLRSFISMAEGQGGLSSDFVRSIYALNDQSVLQNLVTALADSDANLTTIEELLERDKQREKDGFPRKISIGRLVKPGKGGMGSVVVVPTTVEEKFLHDSSFRSEDESESSGAGDGEEGDIIGEQPVHAPNGDGEGAGHGEGGVHEVESNAYELGKILTERFELPNLLDKGRKRALTRYTYEMTDRKRGVGQIVDKKATLKRILQTNLALGRVKESDTVDPSGLLVSPSDRIFRILSREKEYESQAMVFFLRDYSGSMAGRCTELVVAQHVMIYSWLTYQYDKRVESRFILHDIEAKEVEDFYTYYNSRVAGGTQISSAFLLVNSIVEKESLAQDYNIYVFYGGDGGDWDRMGEATLPAIEKMFTYVNRIGVTVVKHANEAKSKTSFEAYLDESRLPKRHPNLLQVDTFTEDADEDRLIEGIKKLLSEKVTSS